MDLVKCRLKWQHDVTCWIAELEGSRKVGIYGITAFGEVSFVTKVDRAGFFSCWERVPVDPKPATPADIRSAIRVERMACADAARRTCNALSPNVDLTSVNILVQSAILSRP